MKTMLIILAIIVAIPVLLFMLHIMFFAHLGHSIADSHKLHIIQTLGYDFGEQYALLYSRLRDGASWVLSFQDNDTWKHLLAHCQVMKEGKSLVNMNDGVYRVQVSKEQEDYECLWGNNSINGTYKIDFLITKELNNEMTHPIITIRIDYSDRILFYDYDDGI